MKLLYVAADQSLSAYHGGTIHILSLADQLTRQGHEVHVAYQNEGAPLLRENSKLQLYPLKKHRRFLLWRSGDEIEQLLKKVAPDVLVERYYNFSGEAVIRANRMNIPTALEVNSPMVEYPGSFKSFVDGFTGGMMLRRRNSIARAATLIFVPFKKIIPIEFQHKVREIEWGVDTNLFNPLALPDRKELRAKHGFEQNAILLIHFGSLRSWHGLPKLMKAFEQVRPQLPQPTKLIVIGPSEKKISDNVHFVGEVPHHELPSWLKMSDVAVLPFSPEEHPYLKLGFYWSPLKLFEAMAMEMPVITLKHPRLISLLGTEEPGFYFDGTSEDLANKILAMTQTLESNKIAARSFRERVIREFSWEEHAKKLIAWLEEIRTR